MSAADLQWPELQDLMTHFRPNTDQEKASQRVKAVVQNPHLTEWFFLHSAENFLTYFFENCLDVKDYWTRIEYQHRGSAHMHGLAWMDSIPDVDGISENWVRVQYPTDDEPIALGTVHVQTMKPKRSMIFQIVWLAPGIL